MEARMIPVIRSLDTIGPSMLLCSLLPCSGETILGLRESLKWATDCLTEVDSSVAVSSGGELFLRFISLTSLEHQVRAIHSHRLLHIHSEKNVGQSSLKASPPPPCLSQDLSRCKKVMEERGELFLEKISLSRTKVAKLCHTFIKDGAKILTHSSSRVVLRVLEKAAAEKKRFTVYVTESQPDTAGKQMADALRRINVPVTVVLDAAVGYVLEKVDLVIVGAEGVVESGGIINKIGTYQMAVCSKAHNKPFYVVAESFKFVRLYPLNQQDVPDRFKYKADTLRTVSDLSDEHPMIDYTPPSLITLLFTDLGVLTPSAVSDELIKLYL
uniref:Translation initiation factor eIF2B subunit alpha n=1 Tax=Oncorhynchus tshawytscha TaxID=74940 RepID=A0A8C8JAY5_ONCTS